MLVNRQQFDPRRRRLRSRLRRRGTIAVLTAVQFSIILAMVVFAVDVGYLLVAQTDLQRSADAAAHAAVLEMRSTRRPNAYIRRARSIARDYVEDNKIINTTATVSRNSNNADADGDVLVGKIDFDHPRNAMTFGDVDEYNAVQVNVRRTSGRNGEVALFFARALGHESVALEARATAAIIKNVGGFSVPRSGENVPLLPITIQLDHWQDGLAASHDDWAFDRVTQTVHADEDDIPEVVLFPNDTGSSGNFGTLNVGISANSTSFLGNQIRHGLTQADLDFHGGTLELDSNGQLPLAGNPGLSGGIEDDLASITGKVVAIPLYRSVNGSGNNAVFTIVKFVGVRVMAVQLSGGNKFVSVQPANLTFKGVIQGPAGSSQQLYSPPVIVQ